MKTLSTITLALRAACVFGFCLVAAGLGFYVFDEPESQTTGKRRQAAFFR